VADAKLVIAKVNREGIIKVLGDKVNLSLPVSSYTIPQLSEKIRLFEYLINSIQNVKARNQMGPNCYFYMICHGKAEVQDILESKLKATVVSGDLIRGESEHTTNAFLFKRDSTVVKFN